MRPLGLASLTDLTGNVYNGIGAGQRGHTSASADPKAQTLPEAFLTRSARLDGFARELVGALVKLDAGMTAHVHESGGRPLGEAVANPLDEGEVGFCLPT